VSDAIRPFSRLFVQRPDGDQSPYQAAYGVVGTGSVRRRWSPEINFVLMDFSRRLPQPEERQNEPPPSLRHGSGRWRAFPEETRWPWRHRSPDVLHGAVQRRLGVSGRGDRSDPRPRTIACSLMNLSLPD